MGPEIKQQQFQLQGGKFKSRLCDARVCWKHCHVEDSDCSAKATNKTANKTLIICTIRPIWQHCWQPICLHLRKICSIYFAAKKVTLSRWTCTTRQRTEHTYLPPPAVTLDFWKDERFKMESAPNDSEWHIKESSPGPLQTGWDSSTHKIWLLHWCHKHLEVAALLGLRGLAGCEARAQKKLHTQIHSNESDRACPHSAT